MSRNNLCYQESKVILHLSSCQAHPLVANMYQWYGVNNYNRWLLVAASHPYNLKAQLSNSGIRRLWGS